MLINDEEQNLRKYPLTDAQRIAINTILYSLGEIKLEDGKRNWKKVKETFGELSFIPNNELENIFEAIITNMNDLLKTETNDCAGKAYDSFEDYAVPDLLNMNVEIATKLKQNLKMMKLLRSYEFLSFAQTLQIEDKSTPTWWEDSNFIRGILKYGLYDWSNVIGDKKLWNGKSVSEDIDSLSWCIERLKNIIKKYKENKRQNQNKSPHMPSNMFGHSPYSMYPMGNPFFQNPLIYQ
eukprot:UN25147